MSLLKLAALGAEVLDILARNEEWSSETLELIQTRADLLGLSNSSDEGMFEIDPDYKEAATYLFEDLESGRSKKQTVCLMMEVGKNTAELYTGATLDKASGISILLKNRSYEL